MKVSRQMFCHFSIMKHFANSSREKLEEEAEVSICVGMPWQSSRNGIAVEGGAMGCICQAGYTDKGTVKIIMGHQFAAFISSSSICMMMLLMLLCLPDSAQIPVKNLCRLLGC